MLVSYCRLGQGKDAFRRLHCYTLSDEFRNYKMLFDARVGTSACEYRTSLRHSIVCARTGGAYKSIEGFRPGRLRSGGSCLHSHRQ